MDLAVVMLSWRPGMRPNILGNLSRQSRRPDFALLAVNKCEAFPPIPGVEVMVAEDGWRYPQLLNWVIDAAQARMGPDGMVCKMDDDDWYGPSYLARIEEGFRQAPESAIVGIEDVNTRWLYGNFKRNPYMAKSAPPCPRAVSRVCGPTISINVRAWRECPSFRYVPNCRPENQADRFLFGSLEPYGGVISTVGPEDFFYQRYQPDHGHSWSGQPDPAE